MTNKIAFTYLLESTSHVAYMDLASSCKLSEINFRKDALKPLNMLLQKEDHDAIQLGDFRVCFKQNEVDYANQAVRDLPNKYAFIRPIEDKQDKFNLQTVIFALKAKNELLSRENLGNIAIFE